MRINNPKALTALVAAGMASQLNGQTIVPTQDDPYEFGEDLRFETSLTNETGVTLDSFALDYSDLFNQLLGFSWNDEYTNMADLVTNGGLSTSVYGGVSNKWSGNIGSDGIVDFSASGLGKDSFDDGSTSDTRLIVPNDLVYDPENMSIAMFTKGTDTIPGFASASESDITVPYTASGVNYDNNVIPEPSTYAMVAGFGALALVASRKRREPRRG